MKAILNELCDFLTNARLHLGYDDVIMSELNGIGSIYIREYALRDEVFDFLKQFNDLNVYKEEFSNRPEIKFYSKEYKDEIESIDDISEDSNNDWSKEDRIDWFWQIVSSRILNRWIADKYCVNGLTHAYWYQLSPNAHDSVIIQRFRTRGSNISNDRRVLIETTIRELQDFELCKSAVY